MIRICFYSNLQVKRLDASFWLKLSYWVKTVFVFCLSSSATRLIGLKKGLMANKTAPMQCNASQCDWTFSLGVSVEIQFLSAWCSWDAPALWSICIWIIGSSWDTSILAWYVKTVHHSDRIFWDGKCMQLHCLQSDVHIKDCMAHLVRYKGRTILPPN